jgi:hypothetical protein
LLLHAIGATQCLLPIRSGRFNTRKCDETRNV